MQDFLDMWGQVIIILMLFVIAALLVIHAVASSL